MKMANRYPLLTKLLLIQFVTIGFGLLIFLGVYQFTSQSQLDSAVSRLKEQVTPAIATRQEQWRAWKYLGLDSAIQEESDELLQKFSALKSIKVIYKSELPHPLGANDMVFPAQGARAEDYVVFAELNVAQIEDSNHAKSTVFVTLAAIALLFLGILIFSSRYIYTRVYLPIFRLNHILSQRGQTDKTDFSCVPAIGEMREFLTTLSDTLSKSIEENNRLAHAAAFGKIAKSVAHDIRSPLSALNMLVSIVDTLPENQRDLMCAAINRINQIADGLLQSSKKNQREERISNLVTSSVDEKRLEMTSNQNLFFDVHISTNALDSCSVVDANEFSRVVSNILNNSIEAGATQISTSLERIADELILSIEDNGKGIPPHVLKQLKTASLSFDKPNGHGLGLNSLKQFAQFNEAKFDIQSVLGKGTIVKIQLRRRDHTTQPELTSYSDDVKSGEWRANTSL